MILPKKGIYPRMMGRNNHNNNKYFNKIVAIKFRTATNIIRMIHTELAFIFKPTRRGLWNGHQVRGGAFKARPYKNSFRGPFGPIFWHRKGGGIKIT